MNSTRTLFLGSALLALALGIFPATGNAAKLPFDFSKTGVPMTLAADKTAPSAPIPPPPFAVLYQVANEKEEVTAWLGLSGLTFSPSGPIILRRDGVADAQVQPGGVFVRGANGKFSPLPSNLNAQASGNLGWGDHHFRLTVPFTPSAFYLTTATLSVPFIDYWDACYNGAPDNTAVMQVTFEMRGHTVGKVPQKTYQVTSGNLTLTADTSYNVPSPTPVWLFLSMSVNDYFANYAGGPRTIEVGLNSGRVISFQAYLPTTVYPCNPKG